MVIVNILQFLGALKQKLWIHEDPANDYHWWPQQIKHFNTPCLSSFTCLGLLWDVPCEDLPERCHDWDQLCHRCETPGLQKPYSSLTVYFSNWCSNISGMSALMRKDLLDKAGGFQAFGCYLAEDFFFAKYITVIVQLSYLFLVSAHISWLPLSKLLFEISSAKSI